MVVERCDACPLFALEWARTHSAAGRILDRVLHLDFLSTNFQIPWNEVTAEEVTALRILREERDQYQREQAAQNAPSQ